MSVLPAEVHLSSVDELQQLLQSVAADLLRVEGGDLLAPLGLRAEVLAEGRQDVAVGPELHVPHHDGDVAQEVHLALLVQALQQQLPVGGDVSHRCCGSAGGETLSTTAHTGDLPWERSHNLSVTIHWSG